MTAGVRAALMWVALAGVARAGEWHAQTTAVCSNCHTMHNSKQGVAMRYDGNTDAVGKLLRNGNATLVCLACHNGSKPGVPNVQAPSDFDPPGGGFPSDPFAVDPDHRYHTFSEVAVVPPDGTTPVALTCVSCHDPHGNGAYRNLRPRPGGRTANPPIVLQNVTANGSNAASVYLRSNVKYVSGMAEWCIDCHDLVPSLVGSHPYDVPIFGAAGASWTVWSGAIANRVPVQNLLAATNPPPDPGDRVFCLSCHKAHGTLSGWMLFRPNGLFPQSLCDECHDQ